jgi:2-methylisocitrate lyase-like PEP mutase family enzyme
MNSYETFLPTPSPRISPSDWKCMGCNQRKSFERNGFKAAATTSSGIARSMGYEDGENIPFDLLVQIVERIINSIHIPLSVDLERGYGADVHQIIKNLERLYDLGVVGFNIEDSNKGDKLYLVAADEFQKTLSSISNHLSQKNMRMFINARTDAYLAKLPSPLQETLERIRLYENAGASGIFVPFITDKNEIREVTSTTHLPVNVLVHQNLPTFAELAELGVKRISMGGSIQLSAARSIEKTIQLIEEEQSFKSLFNN